MSRLGKKPISIPSGADVAITNGTVSVKGPLGSLSRNFKSPIAITMEEGALILTPKDHSVTTRMLWGTYASHLQNMLTGVTTGYEKKLLIEGVGYKWEVKGKDLTLALGFSHHVSIPIPDGLTVTSEKNTLTIKGFDKESVGEFAARIKSLKKVEPYKGKGIRYEGQRVRRKQGKKSAK